MISKIRQRLINEVCDARNLERLISSDHFERTYISVAADKQQEVEKLIADHELQKVKDWLKKHEVREKTIVELRDEAHVEGIPNYSRMSKQDLADVLNTRKARRGNRQAV
jgi:CHAT domain-containing protein